MFTEKEIEYLTGQRLGRLATVTPGGRAEIYAEGGHRLGPGFDAMLIRITPTRITSWGIDAAAFGPPHGRTVGRPQ